MSRGIRVSELRLASAPGRNRTYGVSFVNETGNIRPLSIVAGASQTGKTSIIEYILYCLGQKEFPPHEEMQSAVRSALLEVRLNDELQTIERATVGQGSAFASIWKSGLENLTSGDGDRVEEERVSTDTSAPDSLSQRVLRACGLENTALPEAPSRPDSPTQIFSIRDLMKTFWLPNDRIDAKNLVFEQSAHMVQQKFQQTFDVIFDVFDGEDARRAAQVKAAQEAAREAKRTFLSLLDVVTSEHPAGALELDRRLSEINQFISDAEARIREMDNSVNSRTDAQRQLRSGFAQVERNAQRTTQVVSDRLSLLERLGSLRAQYADDKKKLTFLHEAERLFDPLQVSICSACFNRLGESPCVYAGSCSLCGSHVPESVESLTFGGQAEGDDSPGGHADGEAYADFVEAELRAVTRRLADLNGYVQRLESDLTEMRRVRDQADDDLIALVRSIEQTTELPAPYLAARDEVASRVEDARVERRATEAGLRLWERVRLAEEAADRLSGEASRLRQERSEVRNLLGRNELVRIMSDRFAAVLSDIGYPKLSDAYLDDGLVPHVRGHSYLSASSGGRTLISLAWYLALWEIAYERDANSPGLLMIDSPQKNLGHNVENVDPDFADAALVEGFYRHVLDWLAGDGAGAQIVVVDNSPPESTLEHVVVRFSRDPTHPPYGLIDDATE